MNTESADKLTEYWLILSISRFIYKYCRFNGLDHCKPSKWHNNSRHQRAMKSRRIRRHMICAQRTLSNPMVNWYHIIAPLELPMFDE